MEQSELNKKLYRAIRKSVSNKFSALYDVADLKDATTACEDICLQEKIDLLKRYMQLSQTGYSYRGIKALWNFELSQLTEQLNSLKK